MKIPAISAYNRYTNSGIGYTKTNNISQKPQINTYKTDSVSFGTGGTYLVVRLLRKCVQPFISASKKAEHKTELMKHYIDEYANLKNGKTPTDFIFLLSKYPSKEQLSGRIDKLYNADLPKVSELKDCALKDLFPLMKEMSDDKNYVRAAKSDLLLNMVDTGEYINSHYFFSTFNHLPSEYDALKILIIQKTLKDKNANSEAYKKYTTKGCESNFSTDKIISSAALITAFDIGKYPSFIADYEPTLNSILVHSGEIVHDRLSGEKDSFYRNYSKGFTNGPLTPYLQFLCDDYYFSFMPKFMNNKESGMEFFNVSPEYFDDMREDFKIITKYHGTNKGKELEDVLKTRIKQKLKSNDDNIKQSILGFMDISRFGKDYKHLIPANLQDSFTRETKEVYSFGDFNNYRYPSDQSYIGIDRIKSIVYPPAKKVDFDLEEFEHQCRRDIF